MDAATVTAIARDLYRTVPSVRRLQSSTNAVYALDFGDALPRKVFKAAGPGREPEILREQRILRALRARGVEVPPIERTQADLRGAPAAFTITPFIGVCTLGELPTGSPDPYRAQFLAAGRWLAALHRLDPAAIDGVERSFAHEHDDAEAYGIRAGLTARGALSERHRQILERGAALLARSRTAFIHRDFSPSQALTDGAELIAVVDWGGAGFGFPAWDLGLCLAYVRYFWEDDRRAELILDGYRDEAQPSAADLREARFWEAYTVLRLTAHSPDRERAERAEQLIIEALARSA